MRNRLGVNGSKTGFGQPRPSLPFRPGRQSTSERLSSVLLPGHAASPTPLPPPLPPALGGGLDGPRALRRAAQDASHRPGVESAKAHTAIVAGEEQKAEAAVEAEQLDGQGRGRGRGVDKTDETMGMELETFVIRHFEK